MVFDLELFDLVGALVVVVAMATWFGVGYLVGTRHRT
jgi:hypothetical protein